MRETRRSPRRQLHEIDRLHLRFEKPAVTLQIVIRKYGRLLFAGLKYPNADDQERHSATDREHEKSTVPSRTTTSSRTQQTPCQESRKIITCGRLPSGLGRNIP